jgi:hypothetical protein
MWIRGRRAFRPDAGFYRQQRKLRLGHPPRRPRGGGGRARRWITGIGLLVAVLGLARMMLG